MPARRRPSAPPARCDPSATVLILPARLNVAGFKYTIRDVPEPQPGETFETHFGVEASCQ